LTVSLPGFDRERTHRHHRVVGIEGLIAHSLIQIVKNTLLSPQQLVVCVARLFAAQTTALLRDANTLYFAPPALDW